VWSGAVQGAPQGLDRVTIAVENGVMVASIRAGNAFYEVRYAGNGVQTINQINDRIPVRDEHIRITAADAVRAAAIVGTPPMAAAPPVAADHGPIIDMLVAYTATARSEQGGTDAIVGKINQAVTEANNTYVNTGINQHLRLVGTMEVSYTSNGNFIADVQCVAGTNANNVPDPNSTCLSNVRTQRNALGADLVSLWTEGSLQQGFQICGIAYTMTSGPSAGFAPFAYSVVKTACAVSPHYTFAHEIGHNKGANHDRVTDAGQPSLFSYSFDYIVPDNAFRTVMAYPQPCNTCPIIEYFSNPDKTVQGQVIGVPEGQPNAADNRKTLTNTAAIVAAFRACVVNCGVQPTAVPTQTPTRTPTRTPTPPAGGPANDNFANATAINSLPSNPTANTTNATFQTGEPTPNCVGTVSRTVWYRLTLPTSTNVRISTVGSSYDTVVGVYTGNGFGSLAQVACDDDSGGSGNASLLDFQAVAGTTYHVQVGRFGNNSGGSLVVNFIGAAPTATPTRTPTRTATPIPPTMTVTGGCGNRPSVNVSTAATGGQLQVTVAGTRNARILQLQFGTASNALIDVPSQGLTNITGNQTVSFSPETLSASFIVRRQNAGAPTHVNLTVVDGCGAWPTFVGGGSNAGF
jgi:hypothetical protein